MRHCLFGLLMAASVAAHAEIQTQEIPYKAADGTEMIGYYAYDDAIAGPRPGVVVVHEWWGLNDYAKRRARDLAELGYSALAIDMYGEGKNTEHPKDAMSFMKAALADADAPRAASTPASTCCVNSSRPIPANSPRWATDFGGKVVLDMARQGVPLAGVVSFHGALATETRAVPGSVKARVLVEHGAEDSMVSTDDVAALNVEMVKAGADYRFVSLPGAKHGFTNPGAMPSRKRASIWPTTSRPTNAPGTTCGASSRKPSAAEAGTSRSHRPASFSPGDTAARPAPPADRPVRRRAPGQESRQQPHAIPGAPGNAMNG